MNHVQNHPFELPCDENPNHLKIAINDCISVVYGLFEDEGMNHLEVGFMNHPFEPEDEPPFDEIVNHPFEQKADHLFVPPITPSLEEKINNNLNNKINISSSSSKKTCAYARVGRARMGARMQEGTTTVRLLLPGIKQKIPQTALELKNQTSCRY